MIHKKSQMKMMETISVLIIFLILLVFIMIFYIGMSKSTSGKTEDERSSLKAIEISQYASYMPEFQCSSKNIIKENCYDILKMNAFIDFTTNYYNGSLVLNTTYYDLFKYSKIFVYEIYPDDRNWTVYEKFPPKGVIGSKESHIPISLYDATTDEYTFGILNVKIYS